MGGEGEWEIWQEVRDIAEIHNNACCAVRGGRGRGYTSHNTIYRSIMAGIV